MTQIQKKSKVKLRIIIEQREFGEYFISKHIQDIEKTIHVEKCIVLNDLIFKMMKKKELDIYKELGINSKQKISCKGKTNRKK